MKTESDPFGPNPTIKFMEPPCPTVRHNLWLSVFNRALSDSSLSDSVDRADRALGIFDNRFPHFKEAEEYYLSLMPEFAAKKKNEL